MRLWYACILCIFVSICVICTGYAQEPNPAHKKIKTVQITDYASHHTVELTTTEKPHFHKTHDQTVFVKSGKLLMHTEEDVIELEKGSVLFLPRGEIHWAELVDEKGCQLYVVFNPAFDGKDRHIVSGEQA